MSNQANLAALQAVARALGPLRERVVFVGGSTAGLYSTVARAAESRPTNDMDCIIEVVPRMGPGTDHKGCICAAIRVCPGLVGDQRRGARSGLARTAVSHRTGVAPR